MAQLLRHVAALALACLAVGGANGCAAWPWAEAPDATPLQPRLPDPPIEPEFEASLEDAIARALPDVSYESHNPAMTDPLGRQDPTQVPPRIETLGGDGRIRCRWDAQWVYGLCEFPPPAPTTP